MNTARTKQIAGLALVILASVVCLKWATAEAEEQRDTGVGNESSVKTAGLAIVQSPVNEGDWASPQVFLDLLSGRRELIRPALAEIDAKWHEGNTPLLIEVMRFTNSPPAVHGMVEMLRRRTGMRHDNDIDAWHRFLWNREYTPHPAYPEFKALLYEDIDPRFREYFESADQSKIRLDQIEWGGVVRDGIPPLKDPKTLAAGAAKYLADSDVVFGVEFNGESRAYPKRVLAWHEMVKDHVGGKSINGVYCTLCGSMIVYETELDGKHYELGTSGFLYRSNKLMYDHATKSMWSTLEGKPVVGELANSNIQLKPLHVVTTTWGAWRKLHPATTVLSLDTGHRRDYGEGVAYKRYFATDALMFKIPKVDRRLKNKDEVFIVRNEEADQPLAIASDFLKDHPVYHDRVGDQQFVVLTDSSGGNRAYELREHQFERQIADGSVVDSQGVSWEITEDALVDESGNRLERLPAHRAFWFGWQAVHRNTRLVK